MGQLFFERAQQHLHTTDPDPEQKLALHNKTKRSRNVRSSYFALESNKKVWIIRWWSHLFPDATATGLCIGFLESVTRYKCGVIDTSIILQVPFDWLLRASQTAIVRLDMPSNWTPACHKGAASKWTSSSAKGHRTRVDSCESSLHFSLAIRLVSSFARGFPPFATNVPAQAREGLENHFGSVRPTTL